MKCKFCEAELDEASSLCPVCGRDNEEPVSQEVPAEDQVTEETTAEETAFADEDAVFAEGETEAPAKKSKMSGGKLALILGLSVVAVAVVAALIWASLRPSADPDPTDGSTDPSMETTEATIPADGNPDDVTCKGSYTASDDQVQASRDTVVATIGGEQLTVGQLQVYYWRSFYDFMNNYGNYASYFGLDFTQPLDTQTCSMFEGTWQQYFLNAALTDWHRYQALTLEARANNIGLDAEQKEYLENLETNLNNTATTYGFESGEVMLKTDMGASTTLADYALYLQLSYEGYQYFNTEFEKLTPTEEEIDAFFTEHEAEYGEKELTRDSGSYVDVRHILLTPQGGTEDASGNMTYTDEEWAACEKAAQALLDSFLAGEKTEEKFAELAKEHSTDPGSKDKGGLYPNVVKGKMVEEFENWCFDESRKPGETGLVKTKFGYHIMYFVESEAMWHATAENDLLTERSNKVVEDTIAKYPMDVDYSAILLGFVAQKSAS